MTLDAVPERFAHSALRLINGLAAGYLGFVLTSTAIVMQLLTERGELATPAGQRIVSILLLEDLEDMQDVYVAHRDRLERRVMSLVRPD